jgi:hypothetical protein
MHLLQSGTSLDMIRDFLDHVDVKTTQIYARANLEMKRNALEKITDPSPVRTIPAWQQNKDLPDCSVLYNFGRTPPMTILNRDPPKLSRILC